MPRSSSFRLAPAIRQLIEEEYPRACCDACLALHFRVSLAEAKEAALKLAVEPGFCRKQAICDACQRALDITSSVVRLRR